MNGTPCFFINGHRHDGSWDAMSLADGIEAARNEQAEQTMPIYV